MKPEDFEKRWEQELGEFLNCAACTPPDNVSQKIASAVAQDLQPPYSTVFLKLVGVVFIAGSASLLVCPQLGIGDHSPLMAIFMRFGDIGCRIACSTFFMVTAMVAAILFLSLEEVRVIRKSSFLSVVGISALCLAVFSCTSAELVLHAALFWLLGACIGGFCTLQIGYVVKKHIVFSR